MFINTAAVITKSNLEEIKAVHGGALADCAKIGKIFTIHCKGTEREMVAIYSRKNFEKSIGPVENETTTWNIPDFV